MESNFSRFYRKWAITNSIAQLSGLLVALSLEIFWLWIVLALLVFGYYIQQMPKHVPKMSLRLGYANWVSISRLIIIFVLVIWPKQLDSITLFILFLIVVCMDGLDGYLARRFNQTTEAGAMLDMEIDAFFVVILCWWHVNEGTIDTWILVPGCMRYLYEIIFFKLKHRAILFPPKIVRASVAVVFFISLLTPFILDSYKANLIVSIAGLLILASFTLSILGDIFPNIGQSNSNRS